MTLIVDSIISESYISGVTISATTLYGDGAALTNIPEIYTTGFTYNGSNLFTLEQNSGQPILATFMNTVSGLTVNGDLYTTGTTTSNILSGSTLYGNIIYSGGTNLSTIINNSSLDSKAGSRLANTFTGSPKVSTVTFATPFANTSYAITITPVMTDGSKNFVVTAYNKTANGFVISINSSSTNDLISVDWVATKHGEA